MGCHLWSRRAKLHPGRGAAFTEYTTRKGEEPPDHTHPTEDEIFYVINGELTFRCGSESFDVGPGGFMYLPKAIKHGYTIRSDDPVRLMWSLFPSKRRLATGGGDLLQMWNGRVNQSPFLTPESAQEEGNHHPPLALEQNCQFAQ
jgi:quercetin dioxygenase-like cupin family protein